MTSDEMFELRPAVESELRAERNRARKIGRMRSVYGEPPPGVTCGQCAWLIPGRYKKCRHFGDTNGPGTDWQARWAGCGKFQKRDG